MIPEDRRDRLRRFYARHEACAGLRAYVMRLGQPRIVIRLKCHPECDDRTILTTNDPVWLIGSDGVAVSAWDRRPEGRQTIVVGARSEAEARGMAAQGDVCVMAPVEWV